MFTSWLRRLLQRKPRSRQGTPGRPDRRRSFRPRVEGLEERVVPAAYSQGDVFVTGSALVYHFGPSGNLIQTLTPPVSGPSDTAAGMAFDKAGNLYVTNFSAAKVSVYNPDLVFGGFYGSGYTGEPESILFNPANGHGFVGAADTNVIREFDAAGRVVTTYTVQTEFRGTDWVQMAPDNRTLYYTSEGNRILRYDTVTRQQLPDFVSNLPGSAAFALRFQPSPCGASVGPMIVADSEQVVRLDASGNIVQTYDAPGEDAWFAVNLDPDGTSFWSGDILTGDVYKFDIATGNVLLEIPNIDPGGVGGIAVVGELINPIVEKPQQNFTYYATGADAGGAPEVKVYDAHTNALKFDFLAYSASFLGGVRVAVGDVNGDGFPDIITAPGPGMSPTVKVFSGRDGSLMSSFFAFDRHFTGGVYVAAGDVREISMADIVCGADAGGGPSVTEFDGAGNMVRSFMPFSPRFTVGSPGTELEFAL